MARRKRSGGHSKEEFNGALSSAKKCKPRVEAAWSNPCFELWFILHFVYYNTPLDRKLASEKLGQILGRGYDKSDRNIPQLLDERTQTAVDNGWRLEEKGPSKDCPPSDANPGTTVHRLVSLLTRLSLEKF